MKNCLIVGAGLAGLSAGVFLSKKNIQVTILESSPKLGGRAYSFYHHNTNTYFDNGQHILMGCYDSTLRFLEITGSTDKLFSQDSLRVVYVEDGGKQSTLYSRGKIFPFNLVFGLLNFNLFTIRERVLLLKLFAKLIYANPNDIVNIDAENWLIRNGQTKNLLDKFWNHFIISTLNANPRNVSAEILVGILKTMFLRNNKSSTILIPKVGLSQLFYTGAENYIQRRGGNISLNERVIEFEFEKTKINRILSNRKTYSEYDFVISALPLRSLRRIEGVEPKFNFQMEYSPILSVHILLKKNIFKEQFYGLINSKIDWIFNHVDFISIVKSYASDLITLKKEEIQFIIRDEIKRYFPQFSSDHILDQKVIKERFATFIPSLETELFRKNISSPAENLILAGDWTYTGYPSTIEGAILSGELAAKKVINRL